MASSILRNDSAQFSSRVLNCSLSSLVSPPTSSATGAPKRSINWLGDAAVLNGVVQQGGHQCPGVQFPPATGGHRQSGGVIGPATSESAPDGLVGKAVGAADLLDVGRLQIVKAGGECGKISAAAALAAAGLGLAGGLPLPVGGRSTALMHACYRAPAGTALPTAPQGGAFQG